MAVCTERGVAVCTERGGAVCTMYYTPLHCSKHEVVCYKEGAGQYVITGIEPQVYDENDLES